jgi:hypothetical protein
VCPLRLWNLAGRGPTLGSGDPESLVGDVKIPRADEE